RFQSAAEVAALLEGYLAHLRQPTMVPAPELPSSTPAAADRKQLVRRPVSIRKWLLLAAGLAGRIAGLWVILVGMTAPAAAGEAVAPRPGLTCLLINRKSGRCLSVAGRATNGGAKIVQGPTPDKAGSSERWILLHNAEKGYRLLNAHSRLVLEIGSANPKP